MEGSQAVTDAYNELYEFYGRIGTRYLMYHLACLSGGVVAELARVRGWDTDAVVDVFAVGLHPDLDDADECATVSQP